MSEPCESPREATDEPLEVCTPSGQPTGVIKSRDAIHADGDWHVASFVWIFDSAGRILLQRRALDKDVWPGRWDASAAGHVAAGESALSAARRELAEELGLDVSESKLVRVEAHREAHVHPSGVIDREHHAVFLLRADQPLEAYRPGPEVTAIAFVALAKWLRSSAHDDALEIEMFETSPRGAPRRSLVVGPDELVPYDARYVARLAEHMADLLRV